jgi:hypothetical protein
MCYVAYAVDAFGVAQATYVFQCAGDEDALCQARKLLEDHSTIELWQDLRRLARLTRNES